MAKTRTEEIVLASLKSRQKKERNYKFIGIFAIGIAIVFLMTLLISIGSKGIPGFFQYYICCIAWNRSQYYTGCF